MCNFLPLGSLTLKTMRGAVIYVRMYVCVCDLAPNCEKTGMNAANQV